MESYIQEGLQTAGYPFAASDKIVFQGRAYTINPQPYVHPELTIHAHSPVM
jgi:hypothetical protein